MALYDIAFWIVVVGIGCRLIWELIPDGLIAYWKYLRQLKNDKRRYYFQWRTKRR